MSIPATPRTRTSTVSSLLDGGRARSLADNAGAGKENTNIIILAPSTKLSMLKESSQSPAALRFITAIDEKQVRLAKELTERTPQRCTKGGGGGGAAAAAAVPDDDTHHQHQRHQQQHQPQPVQHDSDNLHVARFKQAIEAKQVRMFAVEKQQQRVVETPPPPPSRAPQSEKVARFMSLIESKYDPGAAARKSKVTGSDDDPYHSSPTGVVQNIIGEPDSLAHQRDDSDSDLYRSMSVVSSSSWDRLAVPPQDMDDTDLTPGSSTSSTVDLHLACIPDAWFRERFPAVAPALLDQLEVHRDVKQEHAWAELQARPTVTLADVTVGPEPVEKQPSECEDPATASPTSVTDSGTTDDGDATTTTTTPTDCHQLHQHNTMHVN